MNTNINLSAKIRDLSDKLTSKLEMIEERVSEIKETSIDTIQVQKQREKT